jgi:hypothetical protein
MTPTCTNSELLIVHRLAHLNVDLSWVPGINADHFQPLGQPQPADVLVFAYPQSETCEFIQQVRAVVRQTLEIWDGMALVNPYLGEG